MEFTIARSDRYPVGTTIGAYPQSEHPGGGTPPGTQGPRAAAVATAVVSSAGVAVFTGLTAATVYWLAAQVSGSWVWTRMATDPSQTARYSNSDREEVPFRIDSPADQTANAFEWWKGNDLTFSIDGDGVLQVAGVSAPAPLALQSDLDATDAAFEALVARTFFNVLDPTYGAIGNGSHDDTANIQSCIDAAVAANASVYFAAPPSNYKVTATLNIVGSGGTCYCNLIGEGIWYGITWNGGDNDSVFRSLGWKKSFVQNIKVAIPSSKTGVVIWDVDTDGTHGSSSGLTFRDCHTSMNASAADCVGWRMGHSGGGDVSVLTFTTCTVSADAQNGHIGWVWEHQNCLGFTWNGGGCSNMDVGYTSSSTPGDALGQNGGDGMTFEGLVCTANLIDFQFINGGAYAINGGRFELGNRFLDISGLGSSIGFSIKCSGVMVSNYGPADNIVFQIDAAVHLTLDACNFPRSSGSHTAAFISSSAVFAKLTMIDTFIKGVDPAYTLAATGPQPTIIGGGIINAGGQVTSLFSQRVNADKLGIGNSAAATTLGTVTKKIQVFDKSGNSLGYVPVYDAIT